MPPEQRMREWNTVYYGFIRVDHGRLRSEVDEGKEVKELFQPVIIPPKKTCTSPLDTTEMYKAFKTMMRLEYGPSFQPVTQVYFNGRGEAKCNISLPNDVSHASRSLDYFDNSIIDPTILDGYSSSLLWP
ncbi:hypothetical protein LSUE1_G004272 [Lachnellula suecica]|uniref:Polyketide synthase dehydratase domain-containing protein n=1 Tax=Lachnellula suecica TaxID=602035 RepID=A0A8T9C796_9HELO|nr:hypothetical protein LSUE1_G004272 [Lachnellula suecica]